GGVLSADHDNRRFSRATTAAGSGGIFSRSAGSLHAAMVDPFWAMSPVLPWSRGWAYGEAPTRFYAALSQTGSQMLFCVPNFAACGADQRERWVCGHIRLPVDIIKVHPCGSKL
ncbi:unnamed protein product, partial [Musa hybrid cultivar]